MPHKDVNIMTFQVPDSPMSMLRLMPNKTTEIASFVKQIISAVKSGDANPLEVLVMLRSLELVSELVREEIEENVLTEAEKHSENKFNAYGAIVERCEVGVKYDYSSSGFTEWEQWDVVVRNATETRKEKEAFLRALKEPITTLNENTGEVETIRPPHKTSKSGVRVYLANVK
jgi:hypothetical protein